MFFIVYLREPYEESHFMQDVTSSHSAAPVGAWLQDLFFFFGWVDWASKNIRIAFAKSLTLLQAISFCGVGP